MRHHVSLICAHEHETAQKWICESCGFIYDPAEGDPDGGIPAGTAFEDIPGLVLPGLRRPQGRLLALRGLASYAVTALRSSPARGLQLPLEALVFAVGISTLGAEIAAQRLMAPFFGSSTVIWANTIAIVLLALSVGYWLGGQLADRRPETRALCGLVLLGSALLAVVPFIAHPFLSLSVSAFDDLSVGAFTASLFGTLVLVAVPLLLLGAVSPWAMRLKLDAVEESGVVAGRLYAISTVGSLIGVFFASLWAIQAIGTQRTFLVLARRRRSSPRPAWARAGCSSPAALIAALALPVGTTKPADGGRSSTRPRRRTSTRA